MSFLPSCFFLLRKLSGSSLHSRKICFNFFNLCTFLNNLFPEAFFCLCRPTFYRIFKKKSVEEFQPVPYLLTMINCLFWVLYGTPLVHPGNILVLIINGFGIVMELFYLSMFLIYAKDNKQRVRRYLVIC